MAAGGVMKMFRFPFFPARKKNCPGECHPGVDPVALHIREREQFQEVLETFSATRIEDRLVILDIFLAIEEHLTLAGLEHVVREKKPELADREFLRETMEMFCRCGFARKLEFEQQEPVYEHHHLGLHHDHFICTCCGAIQEFSNPDLERLQLVIAGQFRFHPLQHKMEIYGLCASCMAQRESALSLLQAANGERVRIVGITGGREMRSRLTDMGLAVGDCLEVISNNPSGPCIVAAKGLRLAINAGIAGKIMVTHSCRHAQEE
jgi:Fur family ferric uptake transcriptional regulator